MTPGLPKKSLACLLSVLLGACASAPSVIEPKRLELSGPFTHPSGMVFPQEVGAFVRTTVTQFAGTPDNFGISYKLVPAGATTVTAYVYPAGTASLDDHVQAVVEDIKRHHGAPPYQTASVTVQLAGKSTQGKVASFQYREPYQGQQDETLRSHAYVFKSGRWLVKYRVTNPVRDDEHLQSRVRGLIEALGFPSNDSEAPAHQT